MYYQVLKFSLLTLIISIFTITFLAYSNSLGCNYNFEMPNKKFIINNMCLNAKYRLSMIDRKTKEGFEVEGYTFSLFDHHIFVRTKWEERNAKSILLVAGYSSFKISTIGFANIKKFDKENIGVFVEFPENTAFITKVNGYLNFQDRLKYQF